MARRRSGLPADILEELPTRAQAGVGLDPEYPTTVGDHVCKAAQACRLNKPTPDMVRFARDIVDHLHDAGATHVRIQRHGIETGEPGALMLIWHTGPAAADIAQKFAVSTSGCGTPRLPAWLSLRVDNDFDLRWQPPI